MLILVCADSHGRTSAMLSLAAARRPDLFIHLGDNLCDARAVTRALPDLPFVRVPGNCDHSHEEPVITHLCEGVTLYVTHGHLHGVKSGLGRLTYAARGLGARVALFGHTHMPHNEDAGGLLLFNPGSISLPRAGPPTYGLIEVGGSRVAAAVAPYG